MSNLEDIEIDRFDELVRFSKEFLPSLIPSEDNFVIFTYDYVGSVRVGAYKLCSLPEGDRSAEVERFAVANRSSAIGYDLRRVKEIVDESHNIEDEAEAKRFREEQFSGIGRYFIPNNSQARLPEEIEYD